MSTRCAVKIIQYNKEVMLYHHTDGDPDGVGYDLKRHLEKKRHWSASVIATELVKGQILTRWSDTVTGPDSGYEIMFGNPCDLEYLYIVDCDEQTLRCFYIRPDGTNVPEPLPETPAEKSAQK